MKGWSFDGKCLRTFGGLSGPPFLCAGLLIVTLMQKLAVRLWFSNEENTMAATAPHHRFASLWISDIHLGSRDCQAQALLQFLRSLQVDTLYLVGDVVDVWALQRRFHWPEPHQAVLRQLNAMAAHGTRILYIPGNHDAVFRDFAPTQFLGIDMVAQHVHVLPDGRRLLVIHGDQFDQDIAQSPLWAWVGDKGYAALLWAHRAINRLRGLVGVSRWSFAAFVKNRLAPVQKAIQCYQQTALSAALEAGYDGIVCGHIHVPTLQQVTATALYANTGDWVENCSALIETLQGELQLLRWCDLAQQITSAEATETAFGEGDWALR